MTSSNGSMAIWCTKLNSDAVPSFEAHLNYWRVAGLGLRRKDLNPVDFLEVGILLSGAESIENINIYVPFKIEAKAIIDLGARFSQNDIAQGIFNEILTSSQVGNGRSWIELANQDRKLYCRVHVFAISEGKIDQSELAATHECGGTLIKILRPSLVASIRELANDEKIYFRIRIPAGTKYESPFVKVITPKDWFFQSGFDEIEYVDFRLNESRTLPDRIDRLLMADKAKGNVPLKTVAFLTAVQVRAELSVSNTAFHKNRLLEDNPWNHYAPHPLPKGMMVYHWRKLTPNTDQIESFTAFVKLLTRHTGRKTIIIYMLIAFLFGILGNLAAAYLQSKIGWPSPP
ncbi:hypothetical protein [Methylobacterium sp. WCS2018Hpa-22]|uniref:hypothetical protein n=1 Tax=Methylobacterium sp. WCS2018Hpa-22 TaxID=3073633 RepID=UPI002889D908|nr:hypothetical protein [Methylobacterium sp. WCS2018Hpa-22]